MHPGISFNALFCVFCLFSQLVIVLSILSFLTVFDIFFFTLLAGDRAKYPKLLLASWQQVKSDVIDVEKEALGRALLTAEQEEICFLQMAQQLLQVSTASPSYHPKPYTGQACNWFFGS